MSHVNVREETFRRRSKRAAALNNAVADFINPARDRVAETSGPTAEPALPLNGHAWRVTLEAWKRDAESWAGRYRSGFILGDSRETTWRGWEDTQLCLSSKRTSCSILRIPDPFSTIPLKVQRSGCSAHD